MKLLDQYIPPRWIMCLESVAHLLVMVNFSTNFLIYCSVSKQFKTVLSTVCVLCFPRHSPSLLSNPQVVHWAIVHCLILNPQILLTKKVEVFIPLKEIRPLFKILY